MFDPLKQASPEPGGSWEVDFCDGGTRIIKADWFEPAGEWVEFRSIEHGLVAVTRTAVTDCITHIPPTR